MTAPVVGWSLLLAPGWWHVRLDGPRAQNVRSYAARMLADRSRDADPQVRRALETLLTDLVDDAAARGASDVYVWSDLKRGLPLGAACVATVLPFGLPEGAHPGVVAELVRSVGGPTGEAGVLDVTGAQVPVVRRHRPGTFAVDLPAGTPDGVALETARRTLPATGLDVYVPFPDGGRTLLLAFSTSVPEELRAPMTALFEAMAASLRWTVEDV